MKRTTIWLADEDREAMQAIRQRFGVSSDSDAIRLSVRILAEAREIGLSPLPASTPRAASGFRGKSKQEEPHG